MAALRTLISGELAPVGQRVGWRARDVGPASVSFRGYQAWWTQSGTAALALAVQVARSKRPDIANPRVLLPGYGCPDLVAAVQFAGCAPVLVDISPDDPGMSLTDVVTQWHEDVIAIIAVNFLGVRERMDPLAALAARHDAFLIEDCAQWYPEAHLAADAVVLSFGRGKPVNLMGGGGLLLRRDHSLSEKLRPLTAASPYLPFTLRALIFNALMRRHPYALAVHAPGAAIGETRFHPLDVIRTMDESRQRHQAVNVARWLDRDRWREDALSALLADLPAVQCLPHTLSGRVGRLLRYPVLLPSRELRDRALHALQRRGLGGSAFYRQPMPLLAGMSENVREQAVGSGARLFADRLLTLPLHDGVSRRDLHAMTQVLREVLADCAYRGEPDTQGLWYMIERAVSADGRVVIRVPNKQLYIRLRSLVSRLWARMRGEPGQTRLPGFNPEHVALFSRRYLRRRLQRAGFRHIDMLPSPLLGHRGGLLHRFWYRAAVLLHRATLGRLIATPALVIVAGRRPGGPAVDGRHDGCHADAVNTGPAHGRRATGHANGIPRAGS